MFINKSKNLITFSPVYFQDSFSPVYVRGRMEEEIDLELSVDAVRKLPILDNYPVEVLTGNYARNQTNNINFGHPLIPSCVQFEQNQKSLPAYAMREQIMNEIERNQVTIITGATGSGKSTQVPQYILRSYAKKNLPCRIIVTQPRRIAAVSIAHQVAKEHKCRLGDEVGYQIRNDCCIKPSTLLAFMTR